MAEGADTVDGEAAPTSDEIRERIEDTRREMGKTIDAIEARLNPRRLLDDGQTALRGLLVTARENPLPVALGLAVGMGVVALARRRASRRLRRIEMERYLW